MARPFISYTWHRQVQMEWLRDLLVALGFERPIVVHGGHPQAPLERVKTELKQADCFFSLVSPEKSPAGEIINPDRPAPWVHDEMAAAVTLGLPIGAICEPGVRQAGMMPSAFTWQEVNLSDPAAVLASVPAIVQMATRIKQFVAQEGDERNYPFIYEQIRLTNRLSDDGWEQFRSVRIAARKEITGTEHKVEAPDESRSASVRLVDPAKDFRLTSKERPNLKAELTRNDDEAVAYRVIFDPPLRVGESIQYLHRSKHANTFPLTTAEVRRRADISAGTPWLRSGLMGDYFTITRPTRELVMELQAPLDYGLVDPEVRVYAADTTAEIDEESRRVGTPRTCPNLWRIDENPATGEWRCEVTIKKPSMGHSYCLLVRPSR